MSYVSRAVLHFRKRILVLVCATNCFHTHRFRSHVVIEFGMSIPNFHKDLLNFRSIIPIPISRMNFRFIAVCRKKSLLHLPFPALANSSKSITFPIRFTLPVCHAKSKLHTYPLPPPPPLSASPQKFTPLLSSSSSLFSSDSIFWEFPRAEQSPVSVLARFGVPSPLPPPQNFPPSQQQYQ